MASEDSALYLIQSVLPILTVWVHRECYSCDPRDTLRSPMLTVLHEKNDLAELFEFGSLVGLERKPDEVGEDTSAQPLRTVDRKRDNVAVRSLRDERSAPKKLLERFQDPDSISVLVSLKHRGDQPARRPLQIRVRSNAYTEAALGIDEASHIPGVKRSFLLIICTRHIVTASPRAAVGTCPAHP